MTALEPLNIVRPLKLKVEDFLLLDGAGAFQGYGKTELIDGAIVYTNAQHRPHARTKGALYDALRSALRDHSSGLEVLVEATVSMPPHDAPEPDLIVTSEPDGEGPVPLASVALIVEVADTTLANDLRTKSRRYAAHHVSEYWVADVEARILHKMWEPSGEKYARADRLSFGQRIAAATISGLEIDLPA